MRVSDTFTHGGIHTAACHQLDNRALKEDLLSLYGVGPASAGILMFKGFHRYDALDPIPPGEQKVLSQLLYQQQLGEERRIIDDAYDRWGSYAGLALHYLFEDLSGRHARRPIGSRGEPMRL